VGSRPDQVCGGQPGELARMAQAVVEPNRGDRAFLHPDQGLTLADGHPQLTTDTGAVANPGDPGSILLQRPLEHCGPV